MNTLTLTVSKIMRNSYKKVIKVGFRFALNIKAKATAEARKI
mgnify:CR=1 FL=1